MLQKILDHILPKPAYFIEYLKKFCKISKRAFFRFIDVNNECINEFSNNISLVSNFKFLKNNFVLI